MRKLFTLFAALLVLCLSGCAHTKKASLAPIAPDSQKEVGYVAFGKATDVGEYNVDMGTLAFTALLSGPVDNGQKYHLFEIENDKFKHIVTYKSPAARNIHSQESYYIEVTPGKHRFAIARTTEPFYFPMLVGDMSLIDLNVESGEVYPVLMGVNELFGIKAMPPILMSYTPLNADDLQFALDLRPDNISPSDRYSKINEYAKGIFPQEEGDLPFIQSMQLVSTAKIPEPSEGQQKWTDKKNDDLMEDYNEVKPEAFSPATPFDTYKYATLKEAQ